MAFLIYRKDYREDKLFYVDGNQHYKLAGWQLIYALWEKNGKPTNSGWTLNADQILREFNPEFSIDSHSLVIDFHPNSTERIGLIEIVKIHLFTYGNTQKAFWTPMMLELKEIFYEEDYDNLSKDEKQKIINDFKPISDEKRIFEFLYLNGDDYSWNWGRNGMTNAAFIYNDARKYFAQFFLNGL